jgi:restriction endonuclease S subunit
MTAPLIPLDNLGRVSQGVTLSRYNSDSGSAYRVINVGDLESLYVKNFQNEARLDIPDIHRYQLFEDDVVIAIRGTLLKASVVTADSKGSICNQNTVFFRLNENKEQVNPLYLAALFRSDYFKQEVSAKYQRSTTSLSAIRVTDVRALKIPIPTLDTQNQLAQLFLSMEKVKEVTLSMLESRQKLAEIGLLKAIKYNHV